MWFAVLQVHYPRYLPIISSSLVIAVAASIVGCSMQKEAVLTQADGDKVDKREARSEDLPKPEEIKRFFADREKKEPQRNAEQSVGQKPR